jgi:hypothetical protein
VLRTERDGTRRRAAWEAGKQVGREVAEPLRALVRARNEAARGLGRLAKPATRTVLLALARDVEPVVAATARASLERLKPEAIRISA